MLVVCVQIACFRMRVYELPTCQPAEFNMRPFLTTTFHTLGYRLEPGVLTSAVVRAKQAADRDDEYRTAS